ncbi:conserved hypothetical protein [Talaromyces stipitatus ATCC 10500]|uniref:tRNA (uracil-O(2)-)-methyltransferase n=1 Tax=Talaromyces stipitatus (strain ATCC 10500 / CBS 375.48 / QM 6759 / NRRL 1006) TaxID=441959 RepID=B8MKM0_TALSN|nr:uncharacterized protein TSTA_048180 [Talaromyces stipitatus ATCC 10500]EED15375.1 conserved hypothetical protein [Talaromyces stipitatus ATCC 10500]
MRRKRASIANTEKPLKETIIPSVNILYRTHDSNSDTLEGNNYAEKADKPTLPSASPPENQDDGGGFSHWVTSLDLIREKLSFTPDVMYNLNNFLLGNPNMNSPHLFRADILYDSAGELKTPREKERMILGNESSSYSSESHLPYTEAKAEAPNIPGFELKRTVVSELIPRKPKLDRSLKQTSLYYEGVSSCSLRQAEDVDAVAVQRVLYLFLSDLKGLKDVPFYHPLIRGWGYLYDYEDHSFASSSRYEEGETAEASGNGTLSLHILPFPPAEGYDPYSVQLERILQNMLSTHIRLARNTRPTVLSTDTTPSTSQHNSSNTTGTKFQDEGYNPDKDNIIPRHMTQNTYSRLKTTYSHDLCKRWVETTEPSKHVFEDLAITAFLIELWRNMYGVIPKAERGEQAGEGDASNGGDSFPGFVDIACGNGVLVYVLLMEGYEGWGFDARQRKTWSIFPERVQDKLREAVYIPEPFVGEFVSTSSITTTTANSQQQETENCVDNIRIHNGIHYTTGDFSKGTFVISNHADELTVWTPLLAALACPEDPLPFLSIPCCSHALSGTRYRYSPPKNEKSSNIKSNPHQSEENPQTGDLKALRTEKQAASTSLLGSYPNSVAVLNSMYGSLTVKTMNVAKEVGYDVEKTLLRIPSTRNIGVIGGRKKGLVHKKLGKEEYKETVRRSIHEVVERECVMDGGVRAAARIWIERALGLQKPDHVRRSYASYSKYVHVND